MELNPVEHALLELRTRNRRLAATVALAEHNSEGGAAQDLSAQISGIVDAAVNGGISNFIPFLNGEFQRTHPEILDDITRSPQKVWLLCCIGPCRFLSLCFPYAAIR
jgi:hypothetical protein